MSKKTCMGRSLQGYTINGSRIGSCESTELRGWRCTRLLSVSVRTIIIVFVLSMVFEELGIAEQTVLVAFGTAFGAVMLGLAIAFGTGGKDLAQQFLEKRFSFGKKDEAKKDELSPL